MLKKIGLLFLFLIFFSRSAYSFEKPNFITINTTVVGLEEWGNKSQSPLEAPLLIHNLATPSSIPINWFLRYDVLKNKEMYVPIKEFASGSKGQQIGAYLEVTPDLLNSAKLGHGYQDPFTDYRLRLLSAYESVDRKKIIDEYMGVFYSVFNTYPQTIYLAHLDPVTASYLSSKYLVSSILIDNQSGDLLPYTPNKDNPNMPSSSPDKSLPMVISGWGSQIVEANDLNQFTYQSIGFNNTTKVSKYQKVVFETISALKEYQVRATHSLVNQTDFSRWFVNRYANASPVYFFADTNKASKVYHYQSYLYRVDLSVSGTEVKFTDFKVFLPGFTGEYKHTISYALPLSEDLPSIDNFDLQADLSKAKISFSNNTVNLVTSDGFLSLSPEKIVLKNLGPLTSSSQYLHLKNINSTQEYTFDTTLPFAKHQSSYYLVFLVICALFVLLSPSRTGFIFALLTTFTVMFSGLVTERGLGFYGPNGHDALFHLSLIEQFKKDFFSLVHPQYAGISLQNYHLAVDYSIAILSKLTQVSSLDWYFRFWPLLILLLLVKGLDRLFAQLKFDTHTSKIAYFICFLGSSLGFIPNFLLNGSFLGGESIFWSNQPVSYFLNPPLITSITILVWFIVVFSQYLQKSSKKSVIALIILGAVLAPTKIYSFLLLITSLLLVRKFKLAIVILVFGIVLLSPTLSLGNSLFEVNPLWFSRSMFESLDHLYVERISSAWQAYENSGNLIKLTALNFLGLAIFVFGNLGVRFVGLLANPKEKTLKLIYYISLLGVVIPLFFTQAKNPWNSIQFLYYSQFLLGILVASYIKHAGRAVVFLVILFNLFGPIGTIKDYLSSTPSSRVSLVELDVLSRFSTYPQGIVVSPVYNFLESKKVPEPKSLYAYVSTAYISALSGHQELLSDTINLDITLVNYQGLANDISKLYQTKDEAFVINFLRDHQVGYLYQTPLGKLNVDPNKVCLSKIIDSSEINIYRFQCP